MAVKDKRGVFVVRIWLEGYGAACRASVLDTATREARVERLFGGGRGGILCRALGGDTSAGR